MSADAQIAANQQNSQLSTGPSTAAGKAASSLNNLRLGFRSQTVLLPGEDPAEYQALMDELLEHYATRDLTEERCVREMADADWRLRRLRASLENAMTRRIAELALEFPEAGPVELHARAIETLGASSGCSYGTWLRYERKFENQYDRANREWCRYNEDRRRVADKEADIMMRQTLFGPLGKPAAKQQMASTVQQSPTNSQIARNSACPCGSGAKYKRCCGKNAPPVLGKAA